jgi:hypothetical protein
MWLMGFLEFFDAVNDELSNPCRGLLFVLKNSVVPLSPNLPPEL